MGVFDEQLFALIDAFQITRVELPNEFQNSILASIEAKQNITTARRYKDNMEVTFRTQVLEANQTRQQTVALAHGTANQKLLEAEANAMVTEQSVYAEMYAYGNLTAEVDLNVSEGLSYIWWRNRRTASARSSSSASTRRRSFARARADAAIESRFRHYLHTKLGLGQ